MVDRYIGGNEDQNEKDSLMQLVGFGIGKGMFGVDILMVQEIIRSTPITEVPNSPSFVEGVINLRGDIIPVIDLRKRLNLYEDKLHAGNEKSWILILDIEGRVTGFIVDKVNEVLKIDEKSIEPAPEVALSGLENQYIKGVCDFGAKMLLIILNFDKVLMVEEIKRLKDINAEPSVH